MAQILVYLILFYKNMSQGIPRLIANLFTVVFSFFVISILASEVFSIHITTMLATSAVFSLVLGLALQDTLGNLFSGVAMQIGQPFKIGDWVEISSDSKKWLGQIQEVTWRATFLSSFADETIMIPNKTMAQSQIIIFSNQQKPNRESLTFRIDFQQNLLLAKQVLGAIVANVDGVMQDPGPRVLLTDTNESWIVMKVFYSVHDFSMKYRIADTILERTIEGFIANKINFASTKILITSP
ncbi:MAG: mechanosensitive ion channel [Bdellovibrionaceae bacterium]|nr:mechanosensitive ion channel [Pseudobdellovibrionaceae bacterium]